MAANIFSTYSTNENRVTASILAVIQSLSLSRIERLLGDLLGQSEFELVRFQNQPSKGSAGVPDGEILSSCRLLIETKIKRGAVRAQQLRRHLVRLDSATESVRILLILTPDDQQPGAFDQIERDRVAWASFANLDQSIDELLDDPSEVVSEREAFLLRELQDMLQREKLIAAANDVVVVAARRAWPEYQRHHAYVCQPDRPFQPVARMAFYSQGQVYPLVPKILDIHEHVEFRSGQYAGRLGQLVDTLLVEGPRTEGRSYKVMFLSAPDHKDTSNLEHPITNDLVADSGRPRAFTQRQRYVSLKALSNARTTSEMFAHESGTANR